MEEAAVTNDLASFGAGLAQPIKEDGAVESAKAILPEPRSVQKANPYQ